MKFKGTRKILLPALLALAFAVKAFAQTAPAPPPPNRHQKRPTLVYQPKFYPLKGPSKLKERHSRYISFKNEKKSPLKGKSNRPHTKWAARTHSTPGPEAKPVTAWAPGRKIKYSSLYQDPNKGVRPVSPAPSSNMNP